ncbi:MAG: hypothetical protein M3417_03245 [Actinomycetota bacterium]|nr:hypothetical protein [Actinomycetota bacterium]
MTVVVTEIPPGTPEYEAAVSDDKQPAPPKRGQAMPGHMNAQPLARYLRHFGGFKGRLLFPPTGEIYEVDLTPWRHANPATTYVAVSFKYVDPKLVGTYRLS